MYPTQRESLAEWRAIGHARSDGFVPNGSNGGSTRFAPARWPL